MTVQTLYSEPYMKIVWKLNGLLGWCLSDGNPIGGQTEKCQPPDDDRHAPHWADHPFKESSDHEFSSDRVIREIMHEIILQSAAELSEFNFIQLNKQYHKPAYSFDERRSISCL